MLGGDGIEGERCADGAARCARPAGTAATPRSAGGTAAWGCAARCDRLAYEGAERVLVSHGTPLLSGGAEALRALAAGALRPAGSMSAEVAAQPVPGQDELLDSEALQLIGDLERRFGPRRRASAAGSRGARAAIRRRRAPGLPGGDARAARGRMDGGEHSARPGRPPRRDHGPGRGEDGHQRAQLGRERLHVLPRGRALADLGERRRRACRGARRDPPHPRVHLARGQAATRSASTLATLVVRPRGWHLDERHVLVDGRPVSASLFDLALYLRWNGPRVGGARQRALRLPREAREPLTRPSSGTTCSSPRRRPSACRAARSGRPS